MYSHPGFSRVDHDATLGVRNLNLRRSIRLNPEGPARVAGLIDQDELVCPDLLRNDWRLRVDRRGSVVARSETANEPKGEGKWNGDFSRHTMPGPFRVWLQRNEDDPVTIVVLRKSATTVLAT